MNTYTKSAPLLVARSNGNVVRSRGSVTESIIESADPVQITLGANQTIGLTCFIDERAIAECWSLAYFGLCCRRNGKMLDLR